MDTPDKKTQPSPSSFLNKFEDSPVFNYISTLSPIKSFSVSHSTQSFPLLGYSSPQSLQTPPPLNCPKESKIRSANNASDVSKNNCSQNGSEGTISEPSVATQQSDLHIVERGKFVSGGEEAVRAIDEPSKLVKDYPISVKYECASPEVDLGHCDAVKPVCEINVARPEIYPAKDMPDARKVTESLLENQISTQGIEVEQNRGVSEWEKFMYETSDILNCPSLTMEDHHKELPDNDVDPGTLSFVAEVLQAPNEKMDDPQKMDSAFISTENHDEAGKQNETSQVPAIKARAVFSEEVIHYSRTDTDNKSSSQQQQTTRRRCLVYEMSGSHYRKMLSDPVGGSPLSISAAHPKTSNEKCLVANKPGNSKHSSPFPGIGLHLNSLAAAGREKIIVKRENLTCRRQLINSPCTISSVDSLKPNTKISNSPIIPDAVVRGLEEQKDSTQPTPTESVCKTSAVGEGVELCQRSPKKKRKKADDVEEMDSCKRCNCKRSKCLKLYCECFAAGLYCVEPCNCQDCFNKPAHEETVLETRRQIESRNPLAFAPKVISFLGTPSSREEPNNTPASARHKRGCNCKKSGCLKKYCECFQGGVGCSLSCRCEGCKNTFGQKEGIENIVFGEAKSLKKCASEVISRDEVSKTVEQNQATSEPSDDARQPFRFSSLAPQFPLHPCGQSLEPCETPKNYDVNHTAPEEAHVIVSSVEASEALREDYLLPAASIKSTSPNSKRISPPQNFEASPGWKSCRKLILRSIPSISTATIEKESMELQGNLQ